MVGAQAFSLAFDSRRLTIAGGMLFRGHVYVWVILFYGQVHVWVIVGPYDQVFFHVQVKVRNPSNLGQLNVFTSCPNCLDCMGQDQT